ncbi:crotonase/enoyl-CoA hydratase family protein [Eisenibacter elegans]|jgi:enoyl-CoA hydratase|uniref:crotonase/enoyl-CoA hydratase family protein n=1 Tax=Eisenibacter elegans TaxID=997 RepID=UPI00040F057C|nr:crotonase/enoyl-CoA hydratase family protein [Eisenibacter elegans]
MPAEFQTLKLHIQNNVALLTLNNPEKANAMTAAFWTELPQALAHIDQTPEARVVVLSGEGKHFTSGIDLQMLMGMKQSFDKFSCPARAREFLRLDILRLQEAFTAIERCRKPVIAAIHGACIGGGVDMVTACDMRYCTDDAFFVVKEIDLGMVADVGTLQRLPKIIPDGIAREMVYTGRKVSGQEAVRVGLANNSFADKEALMEGVMNIARNIAEKSPLSIRGTKEMLLYTREHSVDEGLNYIATWNAAMLFSNDIQEGLMAQMQKRTPKFED